MKRFKKVLWPTDFSECAHVARSLACDMVDQNNAELHVLHVVHNFSVEVPDFGVGLNFPGFVENLPERKRELSAVVTEKLSEELRTLWKEEHQAKFAIRFGIPYMEILDYAKVNEIDLIVLGTHGRGAVAKIFLGSVTQRVIQHATCPVLTIRS